MSSLFGAMNTAISGLSAQSDAFGNISDNIANSSTIGYKRVDTAFQDYLTNSSATSDGPESVTTTPIYENNVQGTIVQSSNPIALAIAGQGFFPVVQVAGTTNTQTPIFKTENFYTRAGDFTMNSEGYLVNNSGDYLEGWPVDSTTGQVNQSVLSPIQIAQSVYNPVATSQVNLSANLPATPPISPTTGKPETGPDASQVQVYDALGSMHAVTLSWQQSTTDSNKWTLTLTSPESTPPSLGTVEVDFGPTASGNPVNPGTIGSITGATGTITGVTPYSAGGTASLNFTANYGSGNQTITLNLGNFGDANGVTQYAGQYSVRGLTQNGVPIGNFSGVSITKEGSVVINYNNGQNRVVNQVPIATFNAPNALQRMNEQTFAQTTTSGSANLQFPNANGAGSLVVGSLESSNVDLAQEFSKLIVAQQAYSANTKVLSTADQMMSTIVNIVQ